MTPAKYSGYVQEVYDCIKRQNGPRMKELLDINSAEVHAIIASARANRGWTPGAACSGLPADWDHFILLHVSSILAMQAGNRAEAYDKAVQALPYFVTVFRKEESAWVVHPMHTVVRNLRATAEAVDAEARSAGSTRAIRLGDCGDQLRKCFSASVNSSSVPAKKMAALDIVNTSIKIYFKLNTLRLCTNLIRTLDNPQFPPFESFPASQRVTFKFFSGRLAIFNEQYKAAEDDLMYALRHCHRGARANKSRILKYLVPVGLLLGEVPSPALMAEFPAVLAPYQPLVQAVKTGDVGLCASTLAAQQTLFIRDGTYLLLEKLQAAVQRRLLRRVWALHAEQEPAKAAQIPLTQFQQAMSVLGCEMDMDEVECVAANLIFRKYVKGYISHRNKVMVVAKTDPFPPLSTAAFNEV